MKINLLMVVLVLGLLGFGCKSANNTAALPAPETVSNVEIKPLFNAASLAGKSPKEVSKILGTPSESWFSDYDKNQWQSYPFGEEMTVEFNKNRIKSLVIFFDQKNIDSRTAFSLIGLEFAKAKPNGITNITTGEDWIKIIYLP